MEVGSEQGKKDEHDKSISKLFISPCVDPIDWDRDQSSRSDLQPLRLFLCQQRAGELLPAYLAAARPIHIWNAGGFYPTVCHADLCIGRHLVGSRQPAGPAPARLAFCSQGPAAGCLAPSGLSRDRFARPSHHSRPPGPECQNWRSLMPADHWARARRADAARNVSRDNERATARRFAQSLVRKSARQTAVRLSNPNAKLWFGRHAGETLANVLKSDRDYLVWLANQSNPNNSRMSALQAAIRQLLET